MESHQHQDTEKEISLKDLILLGGDYFMEGIRNIPLILLFIILIMAYRYYNYTKEQTTYSGKITFMINSDDGNSINSVASILGQFGLGGARKGRTNIDKILELSRSKRIVGNVLFSKVKIQNKEDFFINHLIESYGWDESWSQKDPDLLGYRFHTTSIDSLNLTEGKLFKRVYKKIVGNAEEGIEGILAGGYNEETTIMNLSAKTLDQDITYELLIQAFDKLSAFYIDKSIEAQQTTYDLVSMKADSLYDELRNAEYSLANFRERNRGLVDTRSRLEELRLKRKTTVLTTVYAEAVRNTEISDFTLKNTTPFIQVIDKPILPIRGQKASLLMTLIKGAIIGGFLGVIFVVGRKFFRDVMSASE